MHPANPEGGRASTPQPLSVVFTFVPNVHGRLLQRLDRYPRTYGHMIYVDPHLDFIAVDSIGSEGNHELWSGTHVQYQLLWEPFLIKGAA